MLISGALLKIIFKAIKHEQLKFKLNNNSKKCALLCNNVSLTYSLSLTRVLRLVAGGHGGQGLAERGLGPAHNSRDLPNPGPSMVTQRPNLRQDPSGKCPRNDDVQHVIP